MEGASSSKKSANSDSCGFNDIVFSWSLEDIFNENLFKNRVEKIPESFQSVQHYFESYFFPLLEETRAQLCSSLEILSRAPFAEVISFKESKPYGTKSYDILVDCWRNRFSDRSKEPYKTLPGDILVLADAKTEAVSDLQRVGRTWRFVEVTKITDDEDEDDSASTNFKVKASNDSEVNDGMKKSLVVIFLINITPSKRIWKSLHKPRNLKIIEKVLCTNSMVEENCELCSIQNNSILEEKFGTSLMSTLNASQKEAVLACLRNMHCDHKSDVELIWGPPGTGKTKTVSMFLYTLLRTKCRTLTCAPTNVAVREVAARVLKLVKESFENNSGADALFHSLGDILLFGNKERLKVGSEIEEIHLEYRVKKLRECFGPVTGWRHCLASMIDFLENCVSHYHIFLENELIKERECSNENDINEREHKNETVRKRKDKSFLEFARDRFVSTASPLRNCVSVICTHIPKNFILEHNFQYMVFLFNLLDSTETLLFQDNLVSEELEELFSHPVVEEFCDSFEGTQYLLYIRRTQCLSFLRNLVGSLNELELPNVMNIGSIRDFCFQTASLIFCTASSSFKLHSVEMEPLNFLVIDEAVQLKECESTIPLQLPGLKHAILIGDECQLPAMVASKVSNEAAFGRSLFERLSLLGHAKHLLSIQYRMHPSISFFPNSKFYNNQILDASNVKRKNYEIHYLPGPMFGPYSFINVIGGREEFDDVGRSRKNMVEVSVVLKILWNLYKAWIGSKQKLSVGVVSPYAAQAVTIQEKVGQKYENHDGFAVKVKSIDGFQGGEEDIVIISTVRSNTGGSIGFISNPQRTNVALTRARHCLWILGDERTLAKSESIWEALVHDAKNRQCFFNADDDKDLAKAILDVKKEFDQLDDLLNGDSILFRSAKWKVLFSDNFLKSFKKLTSVQRKKSVLNLLLKLSSGWRPKKRNVDPVCGSSQILKQYKVEGLYIVCAVDIVKELRYIQVLKVWDILPLEDIPKLVKRLESIFGKYTDNFINRCKEKCVEGDLEVPKTWVASSDIVRFKEPGDYETGSELSGAVSDGRSYVENTKVSESLLLMKFYSLSSGVVSHLLSDRDGRELDLPFEVTDQQLEITLFPRSSFVLGRSGTGKTIVLTMKLFQKEQLHHMANEGLYGVQSNTLQHPSLGNEDADAIGEKKGDVLHQLFVTVSPKLCYAVKQHISHLQRSACGGKISAESIIDIDDIDDTAQFKDIPDSFVDIPPKSFPLVITFHKFLMMLDGTLGDSYFERFHDVRKFSDSQIRSLRSVAIQTFIRTKEVNYDRFSSSYWPHFNTQLTKKLDSSRVFVEIISHIKGGQGAMEADDGKLSRENYVQLSGGRVSSLSRQKRERIYDIFQNYERMKMQNGVFDLADLVIDLHRRLRDLRYEGDEMDFVYIDEVQDLTMSQIALFKYICKNVEEGFVFSGDTAQTIARGIDFRFQDIRSLFYKKFVLESVNYRHEGRKEKGHLSDIFNLSQNFRTHSGVLKLSQSIIELLYRFFPHSIDALKPETSLVYGEPPVLLESGNNENAIITIFGNSGNIGGNMVGFGAEQVILVRDDCARMDISSYVGKQALVLTIVECKGLEFQDVLLYNFFGSSPLKNQWRVIYGYMKEQDLLDSTLHQSFPSFDEAKHNVLCSELKQLYVAITRTRQRLWICENIEEISKPMFDYWKKKFLVQVRQLDDSLAQAMQVASSQEEWKSRGIKLFSEHNYEMATMCFERAGDAYWERRSKASSLKAAADRILSSNPDEANVILREAAEIFEAIGKADSAAKCFSDLGEYERAGRIYLEKCGESELERAGECFCLAGCYKFAADVYARGNYFSECLAVCCKGKLFDMGLQYIQYWKQHSIMDNGLVKRSKEIDKLEQDFLESCALHYHELKDEKSMIKFVKAFQSMDLKRNFLKSLGRLDELLLLEEESGNFLEAANIAKLRGYILCAADLLGKAGNYKEASTLTLSYVFSYSLWSPGSEGWPLKQFKQKKELLTKAKSFAKESKSNHFYEFACTEADILSNDQSNLLVMKQQLNASRSQKSVRGEILSARKMLDAHLNLNTSKYEWVDEFVFDLLRHSEDMISTNKVSIETLVYFWNYWRDKILNIFECLRHLETQDGNEDRSYAEFCLNYLGVWKQFNNVNTIYLLLNSEAHWVRDLDDRYFQSGKLGSIEVCQLVSVARSYWCSELLSVGMKVLDSLEALHKCSIKNSLSMFCQSRSLSYIYEVAKFLFESKFLDCRYHDTKSLKRFLYLSTGSFFSYMFPLDWRESVRENMISLRGTEVSRSILKEIVFENISSKKLSYGQSGRVAEIILGSGKLNNDFYAEVAERFDGNSPWKAFIETFCGNIGSESLLKSMPGNNNEAPREASLIWGLHGALEDTYGANWRKEYDYISPASFLYLVERLLILLSYFQGYFFSTKSSFVEWLIHQEGNTNPSSSLAADVNHSFIDILKFVIYVVRQLLDNEKETKDWIKKSNPNEKDYYRVLVLRLIVILCLIHVNFRICLDLLNNYMCRRYITEQLPREFYDILRGRGRRNNLNVNELAEAFRKIDNPLVIVILGENCPKFACPDAIYVDMKGNKCREDILLLLFPKIIEASQPHTGAVEIEATNSSQEGLSPDGYDQGGSSKPLQSSHFTSVADKDLNARNKNEGNLLMNCDGFWEKFETLQSVVNGKDQRSIVSDAPRIKVGVEKCIHLLTAAMHGCSQNNPFGGEGKHIMGEAAIMLDELKQLCAAFNGSEVKLQKDISTIGEIFKRLQSRRPTMEPLLNQLLLHQDTNLAGEASETGFASAGQCDEEEDSNSKAEESSKSDTGKNKAAQPSKKKKKKGRGRN